MAKHPTYPEGVYLPTATDEDKPVPVEVKMLVWVKRQAWEAEYSVETTEPGYDFEEMFRDQFISDCQDTFVDHDEMPNVTGVTS